MEREGRKREREMKRRNEKKRRCGGLKRCESKGKTGKFWMCGRVKMYRNFWNT